MLNRLFIVVGLIAILALAAAFIVPGFIRWEDYRDRLEQMASDTLGAPVAITGDIDLSLLPEPQLRLTKVVVGAADRPVMTVGRVDARFSLVDFFRDHYSLTQLVLSEPVLDLRLDAGGQVETMIAPGSSLSNSMVSVAAAQVTDGLVRIDDARSGAVLEAAAVTGELRLESVNGPFGFQGSGTYDGAGYALRLAAGRLDEEGAATLSVFVQPVGQGNSLALEGTLSTASGLAFDGDATYRQAPPQPPDGAQQDVGRGDLVVAGKLKASPERLVLSDYTVTPDENRPASRLTGAAEVQLGATPRFNAVVSSTSLALPPRDATSEAAAAPYELVRLLSEIGLPPVPPIPGSLGVDIAEVDLRAVTLRNLTLDATVDAGGWQIEKLEATLPGGTALTLDGSLTALSGRPNFAGHVALKSERIDVLAQLWRRASGDSPLFGASGGYTADVALVGETLSLANGVLTLDRAEHAVAAEIGFGATSRHLNLRVQLAAMNEAESAELAALLPDGGQAGPFALTFPKGLFDIRMPSAELFALPITNLKLAGSWEGGVVSVDQLAADALGGAGLSARLTAFGSLSRPEVSGTIAVSIPDAGARLLPVLFDQVGVPPATRAFLSRWLPADLTVQLDAPSGEGGQQVTITGMASSANLKLDAKVSAGALRALSGPFTVSLDVTAADAAAASQLLGLGDFALGAPEDGMHVVAIVEGTPSNSLETTIRIDAGVDMLAFAGNVVATNPDRLAGSGTIKATLSEPAALAGGFGADGIDLPPITGSAHLDFDGVTSIVLDQIVASSGGEQFTGQLELADAGGQRSVTGEIGAGRIAPAALFAVLAGRQALLGAAGEVWPDGPIGVGNGPRTLTGRIRVTAPALVEGDRELANEVSFDLDWDRSTTRLRQFAAKVGDGTIALDAAICCAGPLPQKQLSGRAAITGVELDRLLPEALASGLSGRFDGAVQFDGTGEDLRTLLEAMTGQGTYSVAGLQIAGLAPDAFARAAAIDKVLESDPLVLTAALVDQLDDDSLAADDIQGSFTIAGGTLRSPNLQITGGGLKLFGTISVKLADLALGGGFAVTPQSPLSPGLLTEAMAKFAINLGGTLLDPVRTFDAAGMVEAMKARSLELEVERLEALRAEDEARRKAAAEEQARLAAEQARQEAERRAAAEREAQQRAEEEAARAAEPSTDIIGPLELIVPAN